MDNKKLLYEATHLDTDTLAEAFGILYGSEWKKKLNNSSKAADIVSVLRDSSRLCVAIENWFSFVDFIKEKVKENDRVIKSQTFDNDFFGVTIEETTHNLKIKTYKMKVDFKYKVSEKCLIDYVRPTKLYTTNFPTFGMLSAESTISLEKTNISFEEICDNLKEIEKDICKDFVSYEEVLDEVKDLKGIELYKGFGKYTCKDLRYGDHWRSLQEYSVIFFDNPTPFKKDLIKIKRR